MAVMSSHVFIHILSISNENFSKLSEKYELITYGCNHRDTTQSVNHFTFPKQNRGFIYFKLAKHGA